MAFFPGVFVPALFSALGLPFLPDVVLALAALLDAFTTDLFALLIDFEELLALLLLWLSHSE